MFDPKIKINKPLFERLKRAAEVAGYASTDEFIAHVLEREVARIDEDATDQQVEEQLRGLGYIE